jgi:hypothetical protein
MAIEFKAPYLESEYNLGLHAKVKSACNDFDLFSQMNGLPNPLVTEVLRTDQMQINYYVPYGRGVLHLFRTGRDEDGSRLNITVEEKKHALEITEMISRLGKGDDVGIATWALNKFTWHRCRCAVDLRNNHYSGDQFRQVKTWWENYLVQREADKPGRQYEFLAHDIGRGNHFHLGYRDFQAQADYFRTHKPSLDGLKLPPVR